jgi:hypothetical protein
MDELRFAAARDEVLRGGLARQGIGTLGEKTLHAVLKCYFEPEPQNREIKIGAYVADIVGEQGIIEIQTRDLRRLRPKLMQFLTQHEVTVVYPVAHLKWLTWRLDPTSGELSKRRRSSKTYSAAEALPELFWLRMLLPHPHLHVCIMLLELEEYRLLDGWSRDKKRGSSRYERIPLRLVEEIYLHKAADLGLLLPTNLPEEFTSRDFGAAARMSMAKAQLSLKLLHDLGVVARLGKQGKMYLYQRQPSA